MSCDLKLLHFIIVAKRRKYILQKMHWWQKNYYDCILLHEKVWNAVSNRKFMQCFLTGAFNHDPPGGEY